MKHIVSLTQNTTQNKLSDTNSIYTKTQFITKNTTTSCMLLYLQLKPFLSIISFSVIILPQLKCSSPLQEPASKHPWQYTTVLKVEEEVEEYAMSQTWAVHKEGIICYEKCQFKNCEWGLKWERSPYTRLFRRLASDLNLEDKVFKRGGNVTNPLEVLRTYGPWAAVIFLSCISNFQPLY